MFAVASGAGIAFSMHTYVGRSGSADQDSSLSGTFAVPSTDDVATRVGSKRSAHRGEYSRVPCSRLYKTSHPSIV